ncbi:MazG nucleotide pyrophosphohydrolase domain-containing protein [Rothia amarae]|uniref:MazG nucleotide pyrophosphohydrolase domain-containing protein n=1 Tax=Rothia amarae TaxID=169480 RepID=UPI0031D88BDC
MKLSDYQARALETALPTALTPEYLAPMIVGEVGELFGALAKSMRDGWDEERTKQTLTKELGDVAWGVAVCMHELGITEEPPVDEEAEGIGDSAALGMLLSLASYLAKFHYHSDKAQMGESLIAMWIALRAFAYSITGLSFDEVLEANLAKLADRKQRGVIGGSGDER